MIARQGFDARAWLLALVMAAGAAGCGGSEAPHGPPVLLRVYWELWDVAGTMSPRLVWSSDPAADVVSPAPPGARRVDFVFDKVLDGSRIEDTLEGGTTQVPKADPPIRIDVEGGAAIPPPYQLAVWYNS